MASNDQRQALAQGFQHHQRGELQQAEGFYRQVLQQNPSNADALHLLGVLAVQCKRPDAGVDLIGKAVAVDGSNGAFHASLGSALLSTGRTQEGVEALKRAISLMPGHADAHYNLGSAYLAEDRLDDAERHLRLAASLVPNKAEIHNSLGITATRRGDFQAAEAAFRKALSLAPNHLNAQLNLGNCMVESGRLAEAAEVYEALLRDHPEWPVAHFHDGIVRDRLGDTEGAIAAYRRAIELSPEYFNAYNNLGNLLHRIGRSDLALEPLRRARQLRPDSTHVVNNLALALEEADQADEAATLLRAALPTSGDDRELLHVLLIQALQHQGDFEAADREIDALAQAEPDSVVPPALRVANRSATLEDEDVARLSAALDDPALSPRLAANFCFALGNHFDRTDAPAQAIAYYDRANTLRREGNDFDPDIADGVFAEVVEACHPAAIEALMPYGSDSRRPIFIVGMPRSGTTLVEQILASHPAVAAGGELAEIARLAGDLRGVGRSIEGGFPGTFRTLDGAGVAEMADTYLTRLNAVSDEAQRVTDKLPGNYRYLGLIAALFPQAAIVHCRRDVRDTCLSIYFQNFFGNHPYSFDLYDIGRWYRGYRQLMDHWAETLPVEMLDLAYEDVVADTEAASRRLLAHCGLAWDPAVLAFHENRRQVRTASAWQVRQPIYTRSVGRWKAYAPYLEPLERGLAGDPRP